MRRTVRTTDPSPDGAGGPPEIDLRHRYDDREDPSELTVYSPEPENLATEWLTVDRSAAVRLDRIR
ncbi:MAG: hypothetical protein ABEH40_06195 [Haloferacaceae archaeon]